MFRRLHGSLARISSAGLVALASCFADDCRADDAAKTKTKPAAPAATHPATSVRPASSEKAARSVHPLSAVIDYARREQEYMKQTVRNFTCRLVKRERINGYLQDMHYLDMEVREPLSLDDRAAQPLSIYLHFLGPQNVAGRKVVYVEGQNENKMLVRNGGRHFDYVVVAVDPDGENAREETLVPIIDIGFDRLLNRMIEVLERHRTVDPAGTNSKVERIAGAKINGRVCTIVRVTHPQAQPGLEFHMANVYVDDELHAPLRVDYSSWPKNPGSPAPLIAEYTYTDLKFNVNLPPNAFSRSRLRARGE